MQSSDANIYLKNCKESQELLYKHFAPKMYGICLRFTGNKMEADDILQEGFIKVFTNLKKFRNEGSLEGWIRKTIINTAINYYRRISRHSKVNDIEGLEIAEINTEDIYDKITKEELLELIQDLPNGYRTVFNLNIIEGYTHKEIGEMLDISDNTSKSQLTRARTILQRRVLTMMKEKVKVPYENMRAIRNRDITFRQELLKAV